jgi:F0F1-type ATP synthase assembly protein I
MQEINKKGPWWKEGVAMFLRISIWVAGPIIVALFVGKYFDKKYDSSPWIFLGLTVIAFIVSLVAIWKILQEYIKKIEKDLPKEKGKYKIYTDEDLKDEDK